LKSKSVRKKKRFFFPALIFPPSKPHDSFPCRPIFPIFLPFLNPNPAPFWPKSHRKKKSTSLSAGPLKIPKHTPKFPLTVTLQRKQGLRLSQVLPHHLVRLNMSIPSPSPQPFSSHFGRRRSKNGGFENFQKKSFSAVCLKKIASTCSEFYE
jgi:hypothetical protein